MPKFTVFVTDTSKIMVGNDLYKTDYFGDSNGKAMLCDLKEVLGL